MDVWKKFCPLNANVTALLVIRHSGLTGNPEALSLTQNIKSPSHGPYFLSLSHSSFSLLSMSFYFMDTFLLNPQSGDVVSGRPNTGLPHEFFFYCGFLTCIHVVHTQLPHHYVFLLYDVIFFHVLQRILSRKKYVPLKCVNICYDALLWMKFREKKGTRPRAHLESGQASQ